MGRTLAFGLATLATFGTFALGTSAQGSVNVDLFPSALVQRIDVVTGGASAAYGSDALAGVVNVILDTRLDGLKAQVDYGMSELGDAVLDATRRYVAEVRSSAFPSAEHTFGSAAPRPKLPAEETGAKSVAGGDPPTYGPATDDPS